MKKIYTLLTTILIVTVSYAQSYEFGIVHLSDNNFKVIATPNFDVTNADAADMGFTIVLPAGSTDAVNPVALFDSETWEINSNITGPAMQSAFGIGDGTKDLFVFGSAGSGSRIYSHTSGDLIDLVSFEVSNMPSTGEMYILSNSDPIATELLAEGFDVNSYFNSNIDSSTTQDYFTGLISGKESYDFSDSAATNDLALVNFNYYPSPVKETLHIRAQENITQISIYNMLGQEVINITPRSTSKDISVSNLANGAYFIKAQVGSYSGTYKFIKQ